MALQKNKVKFGLNKVHWAKITAWSDEGVPTFATPVRLPGALTRTAKMRTSTPITACIMSSTTTQAMTAIWRSRSSPPTSQRRFSVSSLMQRAFWWNATMRKHRSLHSCSSSTATRTTSAMCFTAARLPVLQPRVRLQRKASPSRRKSSPSKHRRCPTVW